MHARACVCVCVCMVLWATDKGGEWNQSPVLSIASIDLRLPAPLTSDPEGSHYASLGLPLNSKPSLAMLAEEVFFLILCCPLYVKHLVIHLSLGALPGPHTRFIITIIISIKVLYVHKHTQGDIVVALDSAQPGCFTFVRNGWNSSSNDDNNSS